VSNPRLLLLDEPFNGLDRENRDTLLELLRELRGEGRTVIVSTHDLEIAQEACTHVLLLASGHESGPLDAHAGSDPHVSEPGPEQEVGHPAGFGPIDQALTLEAVEHAFRDMTVELDQHTVTTTRETE
jgi:energy-coupling factor transporter ATP-binding protein EcfA2